MTDFTESGYFTLEMLREAIEVVETAVFQPPAPIVVSPREMAWAKNPVGKPPSATSVELAYVARTITHEQFKRWLAGGPINP
jgi:hypothetical protein